VFNGFAVPETTLTDGNHISLQCVCGWRVWLTCVVGHSVTCLNTLIFLDNMAYLGKWRSRSPHNYCSQVFLKCLILLHYIEILGFTSSQEYHIIPLCSSKFVGANVGAKCQGNSALSF
jgi:hypothetical protein